MIVPDFLRILANNDMILYNTYSRIFMIIQNKI